MRGTTEALAGIDTATAADGRFGAGVESLPFYRQLWFAVLMAGVALVLLAVFLTVALQKALNRPSLIRERPPLVPLPLQHRSPRVHPSSNAYMFDSIPETVGSPNSVTLKAFTLHMEEVLERKMLEERGEVSVSSIFCPTQPSLQRSISQLVQNKEKQEEDVWEPQFRRLDSGLFEGEEFVDTVKGFSTVRKEHTMFTDTNL